MSKLIGATYCYKGDVPDYVETPSDTWRRLVAAKKSKLAARQWKVAKAKDDFLQDGGDKKELKFHWLRTHYKPDNFDDAVKAADVDPEKFRELTRSKAPGSDASLLLDVNSDTESVILELFQILNWARLNAHLFKERQVLMKDCPQKYNLAVRAANENPLQFMRGVVENAGKMVERLERLEEKRELKRKAQIDEHGELPLLLAKLDARRAG